MTVGAGPAAERLAEAARAWLDTLGEANRARGAFEFDVPERFAWAFVPGDRTGLALGEMTDVQREAAFELVRTAMSERGSTEVEGVIALEPILGEIERLGGRVDWTRRESGRYWLAIYGDPRAAGPWAWRLEGHHVSVRSTVVDGRIVATTPCFLGANPATVRSGPRAGHRVLDGEETLARALLASMSPAERSIAVVDPEAPPEILGGTGRRAEIRRLPRGIRRDGLGPSAQVALDRLIGHYLGRVAGDLQHAAWAHLLGSGFEATTFAWAGGERPGQGHYYAIVGPRVLIEYDNTQNGANHIHSVWRDPANDWGDDVLAAHYRVAHETG